MQKKDYSAAAAKYEAGITTLEKAEKDVEGQPMLKDHMVKMKQLKSVLYSNLSQCLLNLELYRRGMDAATDCLKLDESNAKALYRRALCKEALKLYDQALEDLAALEGRPDKSIGPDDAELSCLRERFQTKKEAHEKRLKEEGPDSDDETLELVTLKQR